MPGDRLRAGIARLERRYRVQVAPSTLSRTGYLAGDDHTRASEFDALLRDPEVRAILLARGGYGIMRILDRLDPAILRASPKLIVGFSDATALLAWAVRRAGVRAIHGPMVAQLAELSDDDVTWLFHLMESPDPPGLVPVPLIPTGHPGQAPTLEGLLMGGNLCLLSHLLGTPYGPSADDPDTVLLMEDVGERPYRIDRYLTHLGLAGAFRSTVAAIVGEFTACDEPASPTQDLASAIPSALDIIDERLRHHAIPALGGAPLAHGQKNLALPVGVPCAVHLAERRLELLQAAVSDQRRQP